MTGMDFPEFFFAFERDAKPKKGYNKEEEKRPWKGFEKDGFKVVEITLWVAFYGLLTAFQKVVSYHVLEKSKPIHLISGNSPDEGRYSHEKEGEDAVKDGEFFVSFFCGNGYSYHEKWDDGSKTFQKKREGNHERGYPQPPTVVVVPFEKSPSCHCNKEGKQGIIVAVSPCVEGKKAIHGGEDSPRRDTHIFAIGFGYTHGEKDGEEGGERREET